MNRSTVTSMRWLVVGVALMPLGAQALTRNLEIRSTPTGSEVYLDGSGIGTTPATQRKFDFKSGRTYVIQVTREGYGTNTVRIDAEQAKRQKGDVWVLDVGTLDELRRQVTASVTVKGSDQANLADAVITVNGKAVEKGAPARLIFERASGQDPWPAVTVRAERPPKYAPATRVVKAEEASSAGPLQLALALPEIRRDVPIEIRANIEGAEISTNGVRVASTMAVGVKQTLVFSRADLNAPWSTVALKIEKEGYEYQTPGAAIPDPVFATVLTADLKTNVVVADGFKTVEFLLTPVRFYSVQPEGVALFQTNYFSQVNPSDTLKNVSSRKPIDLRGPLVVSRISVLPDQPDSFVVSRPVYEERPGTDGTPGDWKLVGANLVKVHASGGVTPMTTGNYFDLDPCVTKDWIYFSSDRSRIRIIWRVPASGQGGFTPITGIHTRFDTEPAVSPDETRLAFVSRPPDAPATVPSYIWIAEADGKLPTQMYPGRSPAWSPDGKRLAYVSPDGRLWYAEVVGSGNRVAVTGDGEHVLAAVWLPSSKDLVYVSNKSFSGRHNNYDLWMISIEGVATAGRQITHGGSFQTSPAVSADGQLVYFFSNRGGTRVGKDSLDILQASLE